MPRASWISPSRIWASRQAKRRRFRPFAPGTVLQRVARRALVNLVALTGNYAGASALLIVFDMQLDPNQPLPLSQL